MSLLVVEFHLDRINARGYGRQETVKVGLYCNWTLGISNPTEQKSINPTSFTFVGLAAATANVIIFVADIRYVC